MAVVNPMLSPAAIVYAPSPAATTAAAAVGAGGAAMNVSGTAGVKDSRWLTLDVCREFTRNKCARSDDECRFAHPPPNVEVQNGRVMCCFDSIKGKCQRREPPCKYLHPPQHLKEQLLQNGRNNLIMKHLQMQMLAQAVPGVFPIMYDVNSGKSYPAGYVSLSSQDAFSGPRYLLSNGTSYTQYFAASPYATAAGGQATGSAGGTVYPAMAAPPTAMQYSMSTTVDNSCGQQMVLVGSNVASAGQQTDRPTDMLNGCVSTCQSVGPSASPQWTSNAAPTSPTMIAVDSNGSPAGYSPPVYYQTTNGLAGGMLPVLKPPSVDGKCVYQPATVAYQQMALAGMPLQPPAYVPLTIAAPAPVEPRY